VRTPRERIFHITVHGRDEWREPAGQRCAIELQHRLATEQFPGTSVRVREQFLGGAKAKLRAPEEDEQ
jgi:hypothetical protein